MVPDTQRSYVALAPPSEFDDYHPVIFGDSGGGNPIDLSMPRSSLIQDVLEHCPLFPDHTVLVTPNGEVRFQSSDSTDPITHDVEISVSVALPPLARYFSRSACTGLVIRLGGDTSDVTLDIVLETQHVPDTPPKSQDIVSTTPSVTFIAASCLAPQYDAQPPAAAQHFPISSCLATAPPVFGASVVTHTATAPVAVPAVAPMLLHDALVQPPPDIICQPSASVSLQVPGSRPAACAPVLPSTDSWLLTSCRLSAYIPCTSSSRVNAGAPTFSAVYLKPASWAPVTAATSPVCSHLLCSLR